MKCEGFEYENTIAAPIEDAQLLTGEVRPAVLELSPIRLLNVQQEFRIVRQLAVKLHWIEVGAKFQDDVLGAAGDVKIS